MDLSDIIDTVKGLTKEESSPIQFIDRREQRRYAQRTATIADRLNAEFGTIPPSRQLAAPVTYDNSGYLFPCCDSPEAFRDGILQAERNIRISPGLHSFDFIACRGVSGLAFAAPLAFILHKPLAVIRKGDRHEAAHSCRNYEGPLGLHSYLIVDDITDSGATLRKIRAGVHYIHDQKRLPQPHCVGVYLYGQQAFRKPHYYSYALSERLTAPDFHEIEQASF